MSFGSTSNIYLLDKVFIPKKGYGIVKYIGVLNKKAGIFYGVELTKEYRDKFGESDGTYQGTSYFTTKKKRIAHDYGEPKHYRSGVFVQRHEITKCFETKDSFEYTVGMEVICDLTDSIGVIRYVGFPAFAPKYGKEVDENDQQRYGIELDVHKGNCNGMVQNCRYFQCRNGFGLFVTPNQIELLDETQRERPRKSRGKKRTIEEMTRIERKLYLVGGFVRTRIRRSKSRVREEDEKGEEEEEEEEEVSQKEEEWHGDYWVESLTILICKYVCCLEEFVVSENCSYEIESDIVRPETMFPPSGYVVGVKPWMRGSKRVSVASVNGTNGGMGLGLISNKHWKREVKAKKWLFDQAAAGSVSIQLYLDRFQTGNSGAGGIYVSKGGGKNKKKEVKMYKWKTKIQKGDVFDVCVDFESGNFWFEYNGKVVVKKYKLPNSNFYFPAMTFNCKHENPAYRML